MTATLQKTTLAVYLGVVLAFYLWTASSSGNPFQFGKTPTGYYNLLTEAFLAGRLSLLVEPKKELLALPNPYDPALNERFRLHDASLYKGKYYLSWGLTPALTLFVPFRLTFDRYLDENLAVALFCFGGLVWSLRLLKLLMNTYSLRVPFWMACLAIFCLGLSNVAPYILRRPLQYEVAIASGYCFLFGGLYWLVAGMLAAPDTRWWRLALGSLFLGLAVGSRPHLILAAFVPAVLWITFLREHADLRVREAMQTFGYLFVPWLMCIVLLGLYNYARFESWTEFGQRYALAGINLLTRKGLDPKSIPVDLYFYFLAPSRLGWDFPFVHLAPEFPRMIPVPKGYYGPDLVAGVLTNIPLLNLLFVLPFAFKKVKRRSLHLTMAWLIVLGLALAFVVSARRATMRYVVDFVSLLLLPALLLWFALDEELKDRRGAQTVLRTLAIASITYGCLFNLAISLTGAQNLMKRHNPTTYAAIKRLFYPRPLVRAFHSPQQYGPLALSVRFPQPFPKLQEPLVVTGEPEAGDFAFVKYLDEPSIVFGFDHWGRGGPTSAPIRIAPGEAYDLEIEMGSLYPDEPYLFEFFFPQASFDEAKRMFRLKLNGREVLRDQFRFHPSSRSQVTVGENRIGGNVTEKYFSGSILSSRRIAPPRNHANP